MTFACDYGLGIRQGSVLIVAAVMLMLCACNAPPTSGAPSDDPNDYVVDTKTSYQLDVSEPRWVVPSDALPSPIEANTSNNNVAIHFHGNRLFFAWRTAPTHFADKKTVLYVMSSTDRGETWDYEYTSALKSDIREPNFYSVGEHLYLIYFQAGTNPTAFQPKAVWRHQRRGLGDWSSKEAWLEPGDVPWDLKRRNGRWYLTSHYRSPETANGDGENDNAGVRLHISDDGHNWVPTLVIQGSSEAGFEFDLEGRLWAVLRGSPEETGVMGARLCFAEPDQLTKWNCDATDRWKYDSPKMFRHGRELYLVARRDIGGPYDAAPTTLSWEERVEINRLEYWFRPKRTAIYRIDTAAKRVVYLRDLPSAGDNAFPSIRRLDAHRFLVANYTSPLDKVDYSWVEGQTSTLGTQLYLTTLTFTPESR